MNIDWVTTAVAPNVLSLQDQCCRLVSILYGMSLAMTYTEKLFCYRDFSPSGWLSWRILGFDRSGNRFFRGNTVLCGALFGMAGMQVILACGLLGVGLMCCTGVKTPAFTAGVALTVLTNLWVHARSGYGGDGSQQMNLILGASLLLGFNFAVNPLAGSISMFFIAAQACLSYFTSGAAKAISPVWRNGNALSWILATNVYGSKHAFKMAAWKPGLTRSVCRATIAMEIMFPTLLLGPKWFLSLFFLWGILFHIGNAVFMGLNTFVWSFLATYPALYFVWMLLHRP